MSVYHRILLAVDLTEESVQVGQAATRLAAAFGAQLHVLHAIEPLSLAHGGDLPLDLSSVQDERGAAWRQVRRARRAGGRRFAPANRGLEPVRFI